MFYLCLRIDPIIVVFSNCKNQANLMDITDCGMRNWEPARRVGVRRTIADWAEGIEQRA